MYYKIVEKDINNQMYVDKWYEKLQSSSGEDDEFFHGEYFLLNLARECLCKYYDNQISIRLS